MREVIVIVLTIGLMLGVVGLAINVVGGIEYEDTIEITVEDGDTLWSIASKINNGRYNMNELIYEIKDINNIDANINIGDVIKVPVLKGGE